MNKTILVPTDFRVESLNTLKLALDLHPNDKVNVVLVYAEYLPDSITELIFYSPHRIIQANTSPHFREALEIIKNRYSEQLAGEVTKVLHSNNRSYLEDFLEAGEIDEIYIPQIYKLKPCGRSFDPLPLLKRVKLPLFEMHWETSYNYSEQEHLTALFI